MPSASEYANSPQSITQGNFSFFALFIRRRARVLYTCRYISQITQAVCTADIAGRWYAAKLAVWKNYSEPVLATKSSCDARLGRDLRATFPQRECEKLRRGLESQIRYSRRGSKHMSTNGLATC